ncbi:MAG TPA: pyridoxamine 5'-phosphate oxidase family protein [Acidimicrobiia bacterium]|nr:pyridoxamine 5'-phosphate oxidase family protein [Acidimicrobiia bacterium]
MSVELEPTDRVKLRRKAERGSYERATVNAILDEALIAHVGFAIDGQTCVLPMTYARVDDVLYLHGAVANNMLKSLASGIDVCVTVTLLDAIVLSRSAFHHSMNFRSVVVYGVATKVDSDDEKHVATRALVEHMVPGRSNETRGPTPSELRKTLFVRVPIDEASAKIRTGPPIEDPDDLALPYWGGEIPITLTRGEPVADEFVR